MLLIDDLLQNWECFAASIIAKQQTVVKYPTPSI